MERPISRVLLVTDRALQRKPIVQALARSGVKITYAENPTQAVWLLEHRPTQLPGLVIMCLNYYNDRHPLMLYQEMRKSPATETIPVLVLVESELERVMVQNLHLVDCCCCIAPLSYGSFIFALPALNIQVRDSVLYHDPVRAKKELKQKVFFDPATSGQSQLGI
jgi:CheY-like chemotaxis protein